MKLTRYLVKTITTYGDSEDDQGHLQNNLEYPEIVQYVSEETELFVINPITRQFWPAVDFFGRVGFDEFFVE
jgi:hypothetical protein